MSNINGAIDTAIQSIKDIDLNTITSNNTVSKQISDIGKAFKKSIKDNSVSDCQNADSYFKQQLNGINNPLKKVSTSFKNILSNKKEKVKKLNYKTFTKDTFKHETKKVENAIKSVDQSGGIDNVEKINNIIRESVRNVCTELGKL